jgi:hypothetical protein
MKPIDITYQAAVDKEADKILKMTAGEFLKIDDYGTIETTIDGKKITIGFWHHKYNDNLHHIVFKTSRRCYLILHKPYLNGVKLENGKILKLTDKEIGDHD